MLAKMAYLAKKAELVLNRQNRQSVKKNSNEMAKKALWKVAILAKMACTNSVSSHQPHIKKIYSVHVGLVRQTWQLLDEIPNLSIKLRTS